MSQSAVNVELRMSVTGGDAVDKGLKHVEQTAEKVADATARAAESAAQAAEKSAQAAVKATDKASTAIERAAVQAEKAVEAANTRQRTSHERLSHARETLGMRSEQAIQREIQQTVAAYNRLKDSGTLSFDEQSRAAERMRTRVEQLTNEMGRLTAEQKRSADIAARADEAEQLRLKRQTDYAADVERRRGYLRTGAAVVAGGAAAAYSLRGPAQMAMSFDERVGLLTNTAYAERDVAGRKIGEAQIRQAVSRALDSGITKDAAMDALEKLIADNQVGGVAGALDLLPFIGNVTTGQGGSGQDAAALMGGFIGSGYAKDVAGAKRLMGISSAAATAGAFEKNDMARHLPVLLPLAKNAGLTGEEGFKKLLVLLQQARTTAGTSDEAANNVANLLNKLKSNDTAIDFKKAGRGDLSMFLMDQRAKGVDPLTAWQNVIDSEIAKNTNLAPAIANIQNAKTKEEQDAAIEAIKGMAEGQGMGKFFQDMQAQGALFGMRNKDVGAKVDQAIKTLSGSIVDTDYNFMADKAGVKTRIAGEKEDMAKIEAMDRLTPVIAKVAELFGDLSAKFPLLAGTTMLATGAVGTFAAAAGGAALVLGGGKLPSMGPAIDRAADLSKSPVGQNKAAALGAATLAGGLGYEVLGPMVKWGIDKAIQAGTGDKHVTLGTWIYDLFNSDAMAEQLKPKTIKTETTSTINLGLPPGLVVASQQMQTSGPGTVTMNTGNQWHGAPQ